MVGDDINLTVIYNNHNNSNEILYVTLPQYIILTLTSEIWQYNITYIE